MKRATVSPGSLLGGLLALFHSRESLIIPSEGESGWGIGEAWLGRPFRLPWASFPWGQRGCQPLFLPLHWEAQSSPLAPAVAHGSDPGRQEEAQQTREPSGLRIRASRLDYLAGLTASNFFSGPLWQAGHSGWIEWDAWGENGPSGGRQALKGNILSPFDSLSEKRH